MRSRHFSSAILVIGFGLTLAAGCGPAEPVGTFAVELTWRAAPDTPLRGDLSGIVDTVRLEARRGGTLEAQRSCDYESLGCQVPDVPAGSGYELTAEALQAGQLVYRGTASDLQVRADQVTPVTVDMAPAYQDDVYPPAAVSDLTAQVDGTAIVLNWTATGDDGRVGRASVYWIYWALEAIDEGNLASANPVDGPTPREAGSAQDLRVSGLPAGQTYYFAMKVADQEGNLSQLSNGASATLP